MVICYRGHDAVDSYGMILQVAHGYEVINMLDQLDGLVEKKPGLCQRESIRTERLCL